MANVFSTEKLTRDGGIILEKSFFGCDFWKYICNSCVWFFKNIFYDGHKFERNDYVKDDNDDGDDFGYQYRDNMIAQFKQDLYKRSYSYQDQDKRVDSLQNRIKFWLNYIVVNERAPIPDNFYDSDHNDPELVFYFQGLRYDPELRGLDNFLRRNSIMNGSENN